MSEAIPAGEPLQFDVAEPVAAPAALSCAGCKTPIRAVYHRANGHTVCSTCRAGLEAPGRDGSMGRALLFGAGAALAGWVVYFGVLKLFDYQLSLIAILVGWMVGTAIQRGSGGRGGRGYQALSVALTYLAITASFVPILLEQSKGPVGAGAVVAGEILALVLPFLLLGSDPITLLIIAIGLWQAWKINTPRPLEITGPYPVAPAVG